MGGLLFIIGGTVTAILGSVFIILKTGVYEAVPLIITVGYALLNAVIGFIDDSAKLRKKQNEGLTPKQKMFLQLIAAAIFLAAMRLTDSIDTSLFIPYFNVNIELGIVYYIFALGLLTGLTNAANITDGIDGLASSVTLCVGAFFAVVTFFSSVAFDQSLSLLSAILVGGTLGFLVYNIYPARVFMGDTGSLFLGGLVVGGAFIMNNPLLVVVFGVIYIVEAVSVMMQVSYFKFTHGKRIFKMAPIHHHFEMCGWKEMKIVSIFSIITIVGCALAWFGLQ